MKSFSLCVFAAIAAMGVLFANVALAQEAEVTTTAAVELTYRVLPGDTLGDVALDFGIDPRAIIDANTSRDGVLINHCGYLPRRVRAHEATPVGCAWLREGVVITIPLPRREEAVAPPVAPPPPTPALQPSPAPAEDSSISPLLLPPSLAEEGQLRRIESEIEEIASGLGGTTLSLHRKVNELREGQELLSQELRSTKHLLYASLVIGVVLFLLLLGERRARKREAGLARQRHNELLSRTCGCGMEAVSRRRSPAPSVSPPPPQGSGVIQSEGPWFIPPQPQRPQRGGGNGRGATPQDAPPTVIVDLLAQPFSPQEFGEGDEEARVPATVEERWLADASFSTSPEGPLSAEEQCTCLYGGEGTELLSDEAGWAFRARTGRPSPSPPVAPPPEEDGEEGEEFVATLLPLKSHDDSSSSETTEPPPPEDAVSSASAPWLGDAMATLATGRFSPPSEVPGGPPPPPPPEEEDP
jgi:hypothetical protein